jgi:hypothetical protein
MARPFMKAKSVGVVLCSILLGFSFALAQGKGKGHNKDKTSSEATRQGNPVHAPFFGEHDKEVMSSYWTKQLGGLPPGLAKRQGGLPPGLEKHLRRDGHLPPGLEKKISPFPADLERRLPPLPSDHRRAIYGSIGIILNNKNIVMDFFDMSRR